ncbi:MAG: hypothetical protein ACLQU1_31610 [Bryobacteraceae bacterium]
MSADRRNRVEECYRAAMERPLAERAGFLAQRNCRTGAAEPV